MLFWMDMMFGHDHALSSQNKIPMLGHFPFAQSESFSFRYRVVHVKNVSGGAGGVVKSSM